LHDPADPEAVTSFERVELTALGAGRREVLLGSTGNLTLFNRMTHPEAEPTGYFAMPLDSVRNHLVFVHSTEGNHFYFAIFTGHSGKTSMYQLESDPMFPGGTMSALGRYALCEVINPSPRVRVMVSLTTTLAHDGQCRLPKAAAIGDHRQPLPLVGRGAAQVFSPPLSPQTLAGHHYLALDLGERRFRFRPNPTGLSRLWGAAR
jgi:hypothetical protein